MTEYEKALRAAIKAAPSPEVDNELRKLIPYEALVENPLPVNPRLTQPPPDETA